MSKTRNSHGIKAGKIVENFKQYLTLTLMNRNNKRGEIPKRQRKYVKMYIFVSFRSIINE